jgi:hypothetical protein
VIKKADASRLADVEKLIAFLAVKDGRRSNITDASPLYVRFSKRSPAWNEKRE